jgi:hypothetical protein
VKIKKSVLKVDIFEKIKIKNVAFFLIYKKREAESKIWKSLYFRKRANNKPD